MSNQDRKGPCRSFTVDNSCQYGKDECFYDHHPNLYPGLVATRTHQNFMMPNNQNEACQKCIMNFRQCDKLGRGPGGDDPCSECRQFAGENFKNCVLEQQLTYNDHAFDHMLARDHDGYKLAPMKARDDWQPPKSAKSRPKPKPLPISDRHLVSSWRGKTREELLALPDYLPQGVRECPRAYLVPPRQSETKRKSQSYLSHRETKIARGEYTTGSNADVQRPASWTTQAHVPSNMAPVSNAPVYTAPANTTPAYTAPVYTPPAYTSDMLASMQPPIPPASHLINITRHEQSGQALYWYSDGWVMQSPSPDFDPQAHSWYPSRMLVTRSYNPPTGQMMFWYSDGWSTISPRQDLASQAYSLPPAQSYGSAHAQSSMQASAPVPSHSSGTPAATSSTVFTRSNISKHDDGSTKNVALDPLAKDFQGVPKSRNEVVQSSTPQSQHGTAQNTTAAPVNNVEKPAETKDDDETYQVTDEDEASEDAPEDAPAHEGYGKDTLELTNDDQDEYESEED